MAAQRDWTSLPPEVLNLVAKDLTEISDFVRFRAVCTSWRFSTPVTDLPPQFPWIFEPYIQDRDHPNLRFYSLFADKFYTFRLPKYVNKRISELFEGYLFCKFYDRNLHTTRVFLLNPLNNDKIVLPKSDQVSWIGQRQHKVGEYGISCVCYYRNSQRKLATYRLGQDCWCEPQLDFNCINLFGCLKGMFFSLDKKTGVTMITNITTGALAYVVQPNEDDLIQGHCHFLEASGDILRVYQRFSKSNDLLYEVHRLDVNKSGSPFWVKVKNIGNHAIFIDIAGVHVLEANDLAGIKANCMYSFVKRIIAHCEVVRMDLETGAKDYYPCPETFRFRPSWFLPNLCHIRA